MFMKIKNFRGSLSVEGTICAFVFSIFIIYISVFIRVMWIQDVLDNTLLDTSNNVLLITPFDKDINNPVGKYIKEFSFPLLLKRIFKNDLNSEGYTLEEFGISEEHLNFNGSKFKCLDNKVLLKLNYKITLPFKWIKDVNITRVLIFSRMELNLKAISDNGFDNEIVYITKTGSKYHKENCQYLYNSKIPISLEDAMRLRYTKCKICYKKNRRKLSE